MIFSVPIFKNKRELWIEKDNKLEVSINQAEKYLLRRNELLPANPKGQAHHYKNEIYSFIKEYEIFEKNNFQEIKKIDQCWDLGIKLIPLVMTSLWARWLDLERGLSIALKSENLLSLSLITRTMAEECLRGIALKKSCELLIKNTNTRKKRDLETIGKNFLDWGLPRLKMHSSYEMQKKSRMPKRNEDNSEIDLMRIRLNDYVHPNYGSHQVATTPLSISAPRIILDSIICLYLRFYENPWLNSHQVIKAKVKANLDAKFTDDKIMQKLHDIIDEANKRNSLSPHLKIEKNIFQENKYNIEIYKNIISESILDEKLISEINKITNLDSDNLINNINSGSYPFSSPETAANWFLALKQLIILNQDIKNIESIKILSPAINLFSALSNLKKSLIFLDTIKAISLKLPLTSSVLVRAFLEYHAVSAWVSKLLEDKSIELVRNSNIGMSAEIEKMMCAILIGSRSTEELNNDLREKWLLIFGNSPINISDTINCLPEWLAVKYNMLTAAIHGKSLRGADLLGRGRGPVIDNSVFENLSILSYLLSPASIIGESPIFSHSRIDRLLIELESGSTFEQASKKIAVPVTLKFGVDYFGEGTRELPFRFRGGLFYYEVFYKFLIENNIEITSQELVTDEVGKRLDRVIDTKNEERYFLINDTESSF